MREADTRAQTVRVRALYARIVDDKAGGVGVVLEGTGGRVLRAHRQEGSDPAVMLLTVTWDRILLDGEEDQPLDAPPWDEFNVNPATVVLS
jgi:hypothetical protein